jgi:PIN domain nuclease of toxin-antitoxin system
LSRRARDIGDDVTSEVFVSAVCAWEIATKVNRGRWLEAASVVASLQDITQAGAFTPLPITIEHARFAGLLAGRHYDPFDRMLAAQSQLENLPLVTTDPAFRVFGTEVVW